MKSKICFAYPWATFGGCERVFLNRAIAFKKYLPEVQVDFFFMADAGGRDGFISALNVYELDGFATVVDSLDASYEVVSLVDCPQLLPKFDAYRNQNFFVECHTGYVENRSYLTALPPECKIVATPSTRFSTLIKKEFPMLTASVLELSNFVPWDVDIYRCEKEIRFPKWTRKPVLYFGRMDKLKNPTELLDAFKIIEGKRPGEFMLILCGPKSNEIDIEKELIKRGLGGVAMTLPPVPFHSASALMEAVRHAGGIYVSPSSAESFGLSAAEAISTLLPPVLSGIDSHLDLLGEYSKTFAYPIGDVDALVNRIEVLFDNHQSVESALRALRCNFSAERFIKDWVSLLSIFHN